MTARACTHPVVVDMPGCLDRRCMDCGDVILSTGEEQPGFFPEDDKAAAIAAAKRSKSRAKAEALLQRPLF